MVRIAALHRVSQAEQPVVGMLALNRSSPRPEAALASQPESAGERPAPTSVAVASAGALPAALADERREPVLLPAPAQRMAVPLASRPRARRPVAPLPVERRPASPPQALAAEPWPARMHARHRASPPPDALQLPAPRRPERLE